MKIQTKPWKPKPKTFYHALLDVLEATITVTLAVALVLSLVWTLDAIASPNPIVAVIDSGVDGTHPALQNRVIEEACFSVETTLAGVPIDVPLCPNGQDTMIGPGAGVPCTGFQLCNHGTAVSGMLDPSVDIMSIQVYTHHVSSDEAVAYEISLLQALSHVSERKTQGVDIQAVNISIGDRMFGTLCDSAGDFNDAFHRAALALRSQGIAIFASSGNDGNPSGMQYPACISSITSVATTLSDHTLWPSSNVASFLDLLAPADNVSVPVPGGGHETATGTSLSTALVSGAYPGIGAPTVDLGIMALKHSGILVPTPAGLIPEVDVDIARAVFQAPDTDGDGWGDSADNCLNVTNGHVITDAGGRIQYDADGDSTGNACDCDFNQDNFCGGPDYTLLMGCFNQAVSSGCEAMDMDGDGFVGMEDYNLFIVGFNGPPGPSGRIN